MDPANKMLGKSNIYSPKWWIGDESYLLGGFNPFETYESKWESAPIFGVKKKIFETTNQLW